MCKKVIAPKTCQLCHCNISEALTEVSGSLWEIAHVRGFERRPSSVVNSRPCVCPPILEQPYQQAALQKWCFMKTNEAAATPARKIMQFPVLCKKREGSLFLPCHCCSFPYVQTFLTTADFHPILLLDWPSTPSYRDLFKNEEQNFLLMPYPHLSQQRIVESRKLYFRHPLEWLCKFLWLGCCLCPVGPPPFVECGIQPLISHRESWHRVVPGKRIF